MRSSRICVHNSNIILCNCMWIAWIFLGCWFTFYTCPLELHNDNYLVERYVLLICCGQMEGVCLESTWMFQQRTLWAPHRALGSPHQPPCRHRPNTVLAFTLAIVFRHVEQNYVVGIYDLWTLWNARVWDDTHFVAMVAFAMASGACIVLMFFMPQVVW